VADRAIAIPGTHSCSKGETEFNHPLATIGESSSTLSQRDEIAKGDSSANLLETRRKRF